MIFKIHQIKDDFIEKIYVDSMKDLNDFYEINWTHHLPTINIVDNRKTIDAIKGERTENWIVGWTNGSQVYILNKDNLEKESNHKYNLDEYVALVKHELSHCFYDILSGYNRLPFWLSEGVAIYTSGQNAFKNKPEKFSKFLEFYNHGGKEIYSEAGFFIEALVEKFGKQKLFDLVKRSKTIKTKEEFEKLFAEQYGFNLIYDEINARAFV